MLPLTKADHQVPAGSRRDSSTLRRRRPRKGLEA